MFRLIDGSEMNLVFKNRVELSIEVSPMLEIYWEVIDDVVLLEVELILKTNRVKTIGGDVSDSEEIFILVALIFSLFFWKLTAGLLTVLWSLGLWLDFLTVQEL